MTPQTDKPTAAAATTALEELHVAIGANLTDLAGWLPMVNALVRNRQHQLMSFQTPATQHAIAIQEAHEAELDLSDFLRYSRPGQQWRRPEQRLVGGGHTRTPAATFPALSLMGEITATLHGLVRQIVRALARAGVCAIASSRLPQEPTAEQLIAHVRELAWAAPSRKLLTAVNEQLTWLNDQASRLVDGDVKTALPDPCPHCRQQTLVVYFRDDLIVCGRNNRTRHLEACICPDPLCECKTTPVTYRHEWIRSPASARNSWRNLAGQLAMHRQAQAQPSSKETR